MVPVSGKEGEEDSSQRDQRIAVAFELLVANSGGAYPTEPRPCSVDRPSDRCRFAATEIANEEGVLAFENGASCC